MTGSDMSGLFLSFVKYIFIAIGGICFIGVIFTTNGWLMLALSLVAIILLPSAVYIHFKLKKAEEAYYRGRRESELAMRRNNPAYDALCVLSETLREVGLTHFTTGQRDDGASGAARKQYLLVRAEVAERDSSNEPTMMKNGMTPDLWRSKVPASIGEYPVRVNIGGLDMWFQDRE